MFTSLKKWVKNEENSPKSGVGPPAGMQTMRSDLQRKFAKGVQYNLKILLRGDRNTGKTCLWHRLQGHKFVEEYVPTPEIQAASIHWNYKATDDIVKVDVWDVVDQGKSKKTSDSLKITNDNDDTNSQQMLDASFLDVYKGAHAVIFVFDMTKKWTFQYIEREVPKVPSHIPVLILANHRDMGGHRVVEVEDVQYFVEGIDRRPGSPGVMFLESSMKNGFGLKYIHKFFNLPFLLLQRESLLKQLETNHLDVESCLEELRYEPTSEEQNYNSFEELLKHKNQPRSKSLTPIAPQAAAAASPTSGPPKSDGAVSGESEKANSAKSPPQTKVNNGPDKVAKSPGVAPQASEKQPEVVEKRGFMSRFFKGSTNAEPKPTPVNDSVIGSAPVEAADLKPVKHIDDFVPDNEAVDSFLDEIPDKKPSRQKHDYDNSSSSDDDGGNPMVAGFQEDLDSDDQVAAAPSKVYTYSDSDDDNIAARYRARPPKQSSKNPKIELNFNLGPSMDNELNGKHYDSLEDEPEALDPVESEPETLVPEKNRSNFVTPSEKFQVDDDLRNSSDVRKGGKAPEKKRSKKTVAKSMDSASSSSDDDAANNMVSNVVEDFSSDENNDIITASAPKGDHKDDEEEEEEAQTPTLQLQSSDFDFLEQISSKPVKAHDKSESEKTSSHRTKSKSHRKEGDDPSRKHKHKKKKHRAKHDDDATNAPSTRKTKKKAKVNPGLEAFLAGGENYEKL